jgi:hypothetical protein
VCGGGEREAWRVESVKGPYASSAIQCLPLLPRGVPYLQGDLHVVDLHLLAEKVSAYRGSANARKLPLAEPGGWGVCMYGGGEAWRVESRAAASAIERRDFSPLHDGSLPNIGTAQHNDFDHGFLCASFHRTTREVK